MNKSVKEDWKGSTHLRVHSFYMHLLQLLQSHLKFSNIRTFTLTKLYVYDVNMYENQKSPILFFVKTFSIKFHQNLHSGSQVQTCELTDKVSFTCCSTDAHVQVTCNKGQSHTYRMQWQHICQGSEVLINFDNIQFLCRKWTASLIKWWMSLNTLAGMLRNSSL
jgi:hypothetical protein